MSFTIQDLLDENFLYHIFPNCTSFDLSLLATTCKKFYTLRGQYPRINAKTQRQCYHAARYGYINILVDLRNRDNLYYSAVHGAVVGGHVSVLEWCESMHMTIRESDSSELMETATVAGHLIVLQWLCRKFDVQFDKILHTFHALLQTAAEHNRFPIFEWLESVGDSKKWSPRWRDVAFNGANEFIDWWIQTRRLDYPNIALNEILRGAVDGKHVELCKLAVQLYAHIDSTTFSTAIRHGLLEIVKLFISTGSKSWENLTIDCWEACKTQESFDTVKWCIEQGYYKIRTIPSNFILYDQLDIVSTLLDMDCKPVPKAITSAIKYANMELLQEMSRRPQLRGELLHKALLLKRYDVFRRLIKLDGLIQLPVRVNLDRNIPIDVGIDVFNHGIPVEPSCLTALVFFRRWKLVKWLFDNGKSSLSLVDAKELQQKAHDAYEAYNARLREMERDDGQQRVLYGLITMSYDKFLNCEEYARF